MNTFVIIFRRPAGPISDGLRAQLTQETVGWARQANEAGHQLDPRILGAEGAYRGTAGGADSFPEGAVTGLLFLEAADLGAATRVAEIHPALHFGYTVEVRPWARPPGASAAR